MVYLAGFIIMLTFTFSFQTLTSNFKWEITENPQFPIPVGRTILIKVVTKHSLSSTKLLDALVLEVNSSISSEKAVLNYGFHDKSENIFQGKYMTILNWKRMENTILVNISFSKAANGKLLQIYEISPLNIEERMKHLLNLYKRRKFFSKAIILETPPKLDLYVQSLEGAIGELTVNHFAIATCRAYDGEPNYKPIWTNLEKFDINTSNYSADTNERTLRFNVSLSTHMQYIQCKAGDSYKSAQLIVYHPPSQILLQPKINTYLKRGESLTCKVLDGYPDPKINWKLIRGPSDSSKYYSINGDGKTLEMKLDSPLGSEWIFDCTATNILQGSEGKVKRTVVFIIIGQHNPAAMSSDNSNRNACGSEIKLFLEKKLNDFSNKFSKDFVSIKTEIKEMRKGFDSFVNKELPLTTLAPLKKPSPDFEWFFESFYNLRLLYGTFPMYTSDLFYVPKMHVKLRLWFYYQHSLDNFVNLRTGVYFHPISFTPWKHVHNPMNVTIEICNSKNVSLCKRNRVSIPENVDMYNIDFLYNDLSVSGIFFADSVIIRCYVD